MARSPLCSRRRWSPPAHAQKPLIVTEPTHGVGYLPLYIAIRNGYFAKEGLDVKVMTVDGGSTHTNAVLTGQAFAFIGGPEHNAYAKIKGGELRAMVNVVDRGNVYYSARKGSEPKPGQDWPDYFKGKSFAVGLYGGTPNSITRYLLKKWSLDAKSDVTLIRDDDQRGARGVKSGRAEIGVTSEPYADARRPRRHLDRAVHQHPEGTRPLRLFDPQRAARIRSRTSLRWSRNSCSGVVQGLKYTYADPEGATAIAKKEFPTMALDDLKATLDRTFADGLWSPDGMISPEAWKTAESVVLAAGILKQPVPYDEIIEMKYVKSTKAASN